MEKEANRDLGSPTSNLDLLNPAWNSYQTTPFTSLGIPIPTKESNVKVNNRAMPMPSPRERVMALATGCKSGDVADRPNWSAIPHGDQWINVRSSRGNFPSSDKAL